MGELEIAEIGMDAGLARQGEGRAHGHRAAIANALALGQQGTVHQLHRFVVGTCGGEHLSERGPDLRGQAPVLTELGQLQ